MVDATQAASAIAQLRAAALAVSAFRVQRVRTEFTSSGTWVCPTGVTSVNLFMVGGGGAGGSAHNTDNAYGGGQGGNGGQVVSTSRAVTPGTSYTVTIGLGGAAQGAASSGANGGATSFGDNNSRALGGTGGAPGLASAQNYVTSLQGVSRQGIGGAGGAGVTGAYQGARGGAGTDGYGGGGGGGAGGNSSIGAAPGLHGGGNGATYSMVSRGGAATTGGGGGGGTSRTSSYWPGGEGGSGILVIEYDLPIQSQ